MRLPAIHRTTTARSQEPSRTFAGNPAAPSAGRTKTAPSGMNPGGAVVRLVCLLARSAYLRSSPTTKSMLDSRAETSLGSMATKVAMRSWLRPSFR